MTPTDGFALTMLAMIALTLTTILVMIVTAARKQRKREQDPVHRLLEEVAKEIEAEEHAAGKHAPPPGPKQPKQAPWEQDPDWWRKE